MEITARRPLRRLLLATAATVAIATAVALVGPDSAWPDQDNAKEPSDFAFRAAGDGALPAARPQLQAPRAPLTSAERGYAIRLAVAAAPQHARDVLRRDGPQVLSADLPPFAEGSTTARLVAVNLYDYRTDTVHRHLVDLGANEVVDKASTTGLQPPLSSDETAAAFSLALAATPPLRFVEEFHERQGVPLADGSQVRVVAGAWLPGGGTADAALTDATGCGPQRCAQLLVSLPSGLFLDTTDFVINLSTRRVLHVHAGGPHVH